jgi:hypothetical protein
MESNGTFKSYEPLEKIITEINLIVPKVYLARCSRLAYRAKQVFLAMKLDILLLSNPGMQVKMLLLFTCLEDVKTHLMRFIAIGTRLINSQTKSLLRGLQKLVLIKKNLSSLQNVFNIAYSNCKFLCGQTCLMIWRTMRISGLTLPSFVQS